MTTVQTDVRPVHTRPVHTRPVHTEAPRGAVVVGVDTSRPSVVALRWACDEARRSHRPLHLVHALTRSGAVAEQAARVAHEQLLGSVRQEFPDLEVTGTVDPSSAVHLLVESSSVAGLVVLGSHGATAVEAAFRGSTSTAVAFHAACSVVVVKDREDPDRIRSGVVVGVDGSPASDAAVAFAVQQAESLRTFVDVVHAWPSATDVGITVALGDLAHPEYELEQRGRLWVSESLAGVSEDHPDVRINRIVVHEQPATELLERADGAELLVVGTHQHAWLARTVLGSVSRTVLRRAGCPVAIVRPPT